MVLLLHCKRGRIKSIALKPVQRFIIAIILDKQEKGITTQELVFCEPSGEREPCRPSTLTGSVIGSKSATVCRAGEVLGMFDMGQMNSGSLEQGG